MLKYILLILFYVFFHNLFCSNYTVKQDSTGDFTTIQSAIDIAVDGDSIIVYPGRYYENLIIEEKSITLTSLEYLSNNRDYTISTILDGNAISTVVTVLSSESGNINGFTIKNGSGSNVWPYECKGGGLLFRYSDYIISNCLIEENTARWGGGYIYGSLVLI